MEKVLGLDLGTNSIGWAIIERTPTNERILLDKGVHIFQEGVKIEKGIESSRAADRTTFRSLRRHYFRRRLRKVETIKALSDLGLCPKISREELKAWTQKGEYPLNEAFIAWQRTDDSKNKNPYRCRVQSIDNKQLDRHIVGRALYHIAQRRGFLTNRLESTKESDGAVTKGIDELSNAIAENGCRTLGEYFYKCYGNEKIRGRYTSRTSHYKVEFDEICRVQQISDADKLKLEKAIFFQRPLRSQKGLVGKCTFEPKKSRCPISHPRYEYYRMLCFVNNIRIKTPADNDFRELSISERAEIAPLFYTRVADSFTFDDIAKKLAGKNNYGTKDEPNGKPYLFNYPAHTSISGMPVTARLIKIFGENLAEGIRAHYTLSGNKTDEQLITDVWHVLFTFDKEEKLRQFAAEKLTLNNEQIEQLLKIKCHADYASLSLKAINKINKYLERGYIYSHAVFLANLPSIVSADDWAAHGAMIEDGIGDVIDHYEEYKTDTIIQNEQFPTELQQKIKTKQELIFDFLLECGCGLVGDYQRKLYHPSMIEVFPQSDTNKLGSPRTNAVRNPMAMRALFQLRRLINRLLCEGKITPQTKINIEMARELNNANKRKAIAEWQRSIEKENKEFAAEIKASTGIDPTPTDVLKYRLWKEQDGICLYTGHQIEISEFIGANPRYDVEHTIPRSIGGDDSQMNKTLCDKPFNSGVKGAKIPSQLTCYDQVKTRIENWEKRIDDLSKQIERLHGGHFATKEDKDKIIVRRTKLTLERDYWRGKYERMTAKSVEGGFKNSQLVDAGIISKYAKLYLKSLFDKTYTIKGSVTADFRKLWGLEEFNEQKNRSNHTHHCIDAIVVACIGKYQNDLMSHFKLQEQYEAGRVDRPSFRKPWTTFTQDVKAIADEVFVSHYTPDNMGKPTRKRKRIRGKVVDGQYLQGDTARGSLHQGSIYGSIIKDDKTIFVIRRDIKSLKENEVSEIVDHIVREKVEKAIETYGFNAIQDIDNYKIWMNEEKRIQIKKVRIKTKNKNLLPIRKHRDESKFEHKQYQWVDAANNYMMAIYEGIGKNGKVQREYEIINNICAISRLKENQTVNCYDIIAPLRNNMPLRGIVKTGTMVLFWKENPAEIWELTKKQLNNRLYKVTVMEADGRLQFLFHQKADRENLTKGSSINIDEPLSILRLSKDNFNMLIEGIDFELTITGEIKPLRNA